MSRVPLNALASLSLYVAQLAVAFFVSPILVHGLGDQRYGVWSLVESVLVYLTLFDFGLTASVVRYVARFEAVSDSDSRNRVFSTSMALFGVIGIVAFAVAVVFGLTAPRLFRIPPELLVEARWMFILLGLNIAIGLPLGVYPNVLFGLGQYPTSSAIRAFYVLVGSALTVTVIYWGGGLIALGCVITFLNTLQSLTTACAVHRALPDLRFSPTLVGWDTFREIRGYSLNAFIASLATRISFQTDAIVIGLFLGPGAITFFAIGNKLVGQCKTMLYSVAGVLTPTFSAMEARGEIEGIRRLLIIGSRYMLWTVLPFQIGFILLGKPFITLWMGARYAELSYPTLVILTAPLALVMTQSLGIRALYGTGKLGWLARAMIVEATANLLLSLALARPLGIEGVALGTAIPNIAFNLALMVYLCRQFRIGLRLYVREVFLRPCLPASLLAFGWVVTDSLMPPVTWPLLLVTGFTGVLLFGFLALVLEFGLGTIIQTIKARIGGNAADLLAVASTPAHADESV